MKNPTSDPALTKALNEFKQLMGSFQSVQLATVGAGGTPDASYSPAILDGDKNFFIYVSEMSSHTANMAATRQASVMVIADESASGQIFARKRATFFCEVAEVPRGSEEGIFITARFTEKFGNFVMDHIKAMDDFHLLKLQPLKGRVVLGFGRAFDLTGENLDELAHLKGFDDQGHRPAENTRSAAAGPGSAVAGIAAADVERIVSHMNEDHLDSVVAYVRHFAKRSEVTSARLKSVDAWGMDITLDSGEVVNIPFKTPLRNAHDAHMTLVSMSKEARSSQAVA